jgi:hypothetical protein
MDDTAVCSNFSTRSNAKRAAEKMIGNGTAPAVDYRIKPRDDGRFEIEWKTNPAPATEAVEAEITTASGEGVPVSMAAHRDESVEGIFEKNPASVSGAEANTGGGAPETAGTTESTESAKRSPAELTEDPFPADTWVKVRQGKRKVIIGQVRQRVDPRTWRVHQFGKPEDWTILATAAQLCRTEPAPEAPKSARRSRRRTAAEPAKASRSQYAISADMIAAGKLPEKPPVVTSKANPHYQKHFDRLLGLAKAGDWDAVRDYKVTGSNSYSKMVARYRQDLLAVHVASETAQ